MILCDELPLDASAGQPPVVSAGLATKAVIPVAEKKATQ
jgi:hypothetical protein